MRSLSNILKRTKSLEDRGRVWRDLAIAIGAGVITAYGHPGIGITPFVPLGTIIFAWLAARARTFFGAARIGISFGFTVSFVITVSAREWAYVVPLALTLIGITLYALPQALWSHWLAKRRFGAEAFIATVVAWSLCLDLSEYLGFPTKAEGFWAISSIPALMSGARWFGSNLLCGVLAAGMLGTGVRLATRDRLGSASFIAAFRPFVSAGVILLALALLTRLTANDADGSVKVGIPQMNIGSAYYVERLTAPSTADDFEALFSKQVSELGEADLLALTETYDDAFPLQTPRTLDRFSRLARIQHQAILLSSYLVSDDGGVLNAVGGINEQGKLIGVHRKVDLAPFGEVEYEHGKSFDPLPVLPNVRVGVLVCQESFLANGALELVRKGANLLVSPTSDISFGSGVLVFEHLAGARLRALETGRSMVWASAGGPSGLIDRWGEFHTGAPFRSASAALVTAPLYEGSTLYARTSRFWPFCCALLLAILGLRIRKNPSIKTMIQAPPIGSIRGALEFALSIIVIPIAAIVSVAVVEVMNGDASRARTSMHELIYGQREPTPRGSLARFRTDLANSAADAAAFFLETYGQRTLPSQLTFSHPPSNLSELAQELEVTVGFPTRLVHLNFRAFPRPGLIVQTKTGEFCVTRADRGGRLWVFVPTARGVIQLNTRDAEPFVEPLGLLPAKIRE